VKDTMAGPYEVESKWTISRHDYDQLIGQCSLVKRVEQLNVYFDERWTLADAGATCRIRFSRNESPTFTLKVPVSWDSTGTRRSIEIESPARAAFTHFSLFLTTFDFEDFAPEVRRALQPLRISKLRRVGRMRNVRQVLLLPSGRSFELDSFTLPGGERGYEVEIEEDDDLVRAAIVSEICEIIPSALPSRVSKFQRFTEAARRRRESSDSTPKALRPS